MDVVIPVVITPEMEMVQTAQTRHVRQVLSQRETRSESYSEHGKFLIKHSLGPVVQAIKSYVSEESTGARKRELARKFMCCLPPEDLALLVSTVIIDCLYSQEPFTALANKIGNTVESEAEWRYYEEQKPGIVDSMNRKYLKRISSRWKKLFILRKTFKKLGVNFESWKRASKTAVGAKCIELYNAHTGYLDIRMEGKARYCFPASALIEKISNTVNTYGLLHPYYMPLEHEPIPWSEPVGGGYSSEVIEPLTLVKTRNTDHLLSLTKESMPVVYEAINKLQSQPYKINTEVLEVMEQCYALNHRIGKLPERLDLPLLDIPEDAEDSPELRKARYTNQQIASYNRALLNKRFNFLCTLSLAKKFKDSERLYYPYQLDFRGRAYSVPKVLTPQGSDLSRGLLLFSEGKELNSDGLRWLKIHLANTYGKDKLPYDGRLAWTEKHSEEIYYAAVEPIDMVAWWSKASDPWQFLAACFEYRNYQDDPENYQSCLSVAIDGTCSGIQHYALLMRDKEAARNVNLMPTGGPEDIYRVVSDLVKLYLPQEIEGCLAFLLALKDLDLSYGFAVLKILQKCLIKPKLSELLDWYDYDFDRKLAKRPTMTFPYGSKQFSYIKFVEDWMDDVEEKDFDQPDWIKFRSKYHAVAIAPVLAKAIKESVGLSQLGMDWLQKAARKIVKESSESIEWELPTGFRVKQRYMKCKSQDIKVNFLGKRIHVYHAEETSKPDSRAATNGFPPNLIHSLDASHLLMTVAEWSRDISTVHDSFATHANDVSDLHLLLRKNLVYLYDTVSFEWIAKQLSERYSTRFQSTPELGLFQLGKALESDYIFS